MSLTQRRWSHAFAGAPVRRRGVMYLATLAILGAAAAPFVPVSADVPPSYTLHLGLTDTRFVGARWMLETADTVIDAGTVGPDGNVDVALSLATVQQNVRRGLQFLASVPLDGSDMLVAAAMEARDPLSLQGGGTLTFQPAVMVAPMRTVANLDSWASAMDPSLSNNGGAAVPTWDVASGGASPSSSPANGLGPAQQPSYTPPGAASPTFWVNGGSCPVDGNVPPDCSPGVGSVPGPWGPGANNPLEALPVPTTPNPPQVSVPPAADCAVATVSGACDPTSAQAESYQPASQGSCQKMGNSYWSSTVTDCVSAASQQNIETFRGWSNRVPGDTVQPDQDYGYTETLDNGFRAKEGPFSVDGSTDSTYSSGGTISYFFRADCWSPPSQDEDPSCAANPGIEVGGYGWWSHWGQDLWRWEHHHVTQCSNGWGGSCSTWDYEKVWDVNNNAGNDTSQQNALNGEGERPADVSAGTYGAAGHWNPDTGTQTLFLQAATTYSGSADIQLSTTDAFGGSVDFSASASDSTYQKFYNKVTLRGPNTGAPFMGGWYSYDGNYSPHGSWEWWTCYYAPGWGPGADVQSEAITQQHPCWDYTAAGSPPLS